MAIFQKFTSQVLVPPYSFVVPSSMLQSWHLGPEQLALMTGVTKCFFSSA